MSETNDGQVSHMHLADCNDIRCQYHYKHMQQVEVVQVFESES